MKQLNVTKTLRIICIDALDSNGELSGETANGILKYLKTSLVSSKTRSPFDVIILPKFFLFTGKDAREIMELLWFLRKRVVLISSSSVYATLPSTEVIAVGGSTEMRKAQGSVLDIDVMNIEKGTATDAASDTTSLINKADWLDQDLVQSLATAVVSAICLHILDCLSWPTPISGDSFYLIKI